jgi:sugar phosphate isomerase/epimerase
VSPPVPSPRVAYQLYSARKSAAEDFEAVLGAVGEIGYDGVELAGLHGHAAESVRAWLDAVGLVACGVHTSVARLAEDAAGVVAEAQTLGTDRVILASVPDPTSGAEADAAAATIRELGAAVSTAGGRFAFHNHAVELTAFDGSSVIDRLLAEPAVELELDLGWIWIAEVDPLAMLQLAAPGVPLVHLKDFLRHDSDAWCPIGEGVMDWARLLPGVAMVDGVEWLVVEQDESGGDELDEAARSAGAVRRFLAG